MKRYCFILPLILSLVLLHSPPNLSAQRVAAWSPVWLPSSNNALMAPTFVDHHGSGNYIFGTRACVMVTWNSGREWREIYSLPSKTVLGSDQIVGGAVVEGGHYLLLLQTLIILGPSSWTYRHSLLVTTDGGLEWKKADLPDAYVSDLVMVDNREGLIALSSEGGPALYYTADGGRTWSPYPVPKDTWVQAIEIMGSSTWGVKAYDTLVRTYYFYRTTDRGNTWERSGDSIPSLNAFHALDDRTVFAAGGETNGQGEPSINLIQKSTDGGLSWQPVLDTLLPSYRRLYDIEFADSLNGIAVGSGSMVFRTTDGGRNWRIDPVPNEVSGSMSAVAYPSADDAMVICSNGVLSYRGGETLAPPTITKPNSRLTNHPLEATIVWTPIIGATSYDIEIGDTAYNFDLYSSAVFNDPWLDTTGITDSSLTVTFRPRTRYTIRVRARQGDMPGLWSSSLDLESEGEAKVVDSPKFIYPVHRERGVPAEAEFIWTAVEGAAGYDLKIRLSTSLPVYHYAFDHLPTESQRISGLRADTTYYAQLRARDHDGVVSNWVEIFFSTAGISSVNESESRGRVHVQPNAVTDRITVIFPTTRSATAVLRLIAVDGRQVTSEQLTLPGGGEYLHALDCSDLPSGQYLVVVDAEGERFTLPVVVVR